MRNALKTSFQGVSFNLSYPHARAGLPASAPKDRPALACGSALLLSNNNYLEAGRARVEVGSHSGQQAVSPMRATSPCLRPQ